MGGYQSISGNYIHIDKHGDSQVFYVLLLSNVLTHGIIKVKQIIWLELKNDNKN